MAPSRLAIRFQSYLFLGWTPLACGCAPPNESLQAVGLVNWECSRFPGPTLPQAFAALMTATRWTGREARGPGKTGGPAVAGGLPSQMIISNRGPNRTGNRDFSSIHRAVSHG